MPTRHQRILLMSTVALFLVTGTPVFSVEPRTEKEAAIAAIKKLGGRVVVDKKNPNRSVEIVNFGNTKFTDAGLVRLKGLMSLNHLWLGGTKVTDAGLVHLDGLTRLVTLHLDSTQATDEGVKKLQQALPKCKIER